MIHGSPLGAPVNSIVVFFINRSSNTALRNLDDGGISYLCYLFL